MMESGNFHILESIFAVKGFQSLQSVNQDPPVWQVHRELILCMPHWKMVNLSPAPYFLNQSVISIKFNLYKPLCLFQLPT